MGVNARSHAFATAGIAIVLTLSGCGNEAKKVIVSQELEIANLREIITTKDAELELLGDRVRKLSAEVDGLRSAQTQPAVSVSSTTPTERAAVALKLASVGSKDANPTDTPEIREVAEDAQRYHARCVMFKQQWISADVELNDGLYRTSLRDNRKVYFGAMTSGASFAMPPAIADALRDSADAETILPANIYCRIVAFDGYSGKVAACWVYKVETMRRNGHIHTRYTESGAVEIPSPQ